MFLGEKNTTTMQINTYLCTRKIAKYTHEYFPDRNKRTT